MFPKEKDKDKGKKDPQKSPIVQSPSTSSVIRKVSGQSAKPLVPEEPAGPPDDETLNRLLEETMVNIYCEMLQY
jgi:hypothetical protein